MYKVACTRKEASCIIGSLFGELDTICGLCRNLEDNDFAIATAGGLSLCGKADATITGHSIVSGTPIQIKLTEYGFEFIGDIAELTHIRETRCLYIARTDSIAKESRGLP